MNTKGARLINSEKHKPKNYTTLDTHGLPEGSRVVS